MKWILSFHKEWYIMYKNLVIASRFRSTLVQHATMYALQTCYALSSHAHSSHNQIHKILHPEYIWLVLLASSFEEL